MIRKIFVVTSWVAIMVTMMIIGFSIGKSNGSKAAIAKEKVNTEETQNTYKKNVKVASFEKKNITVDFKAEGSINSLKQIGVTPEVQGNLRQGQVALKSGINFAKGQLLFSINDEDVRLSLKARKSNYLTLLANTLPELKVDYGYAYPKWKGFYDAIDIEKSFPSFPEISKDQERTFIVTKGLLSEYYNIKADEEKLKKYYYIAPFSGTITNVYTNFGASVSPGTKLFDIIQTDQTELQVSMKSYEAEKIKNGSKVIIKDESNGKEYLGIVSRKGDFIQSSSQSVPVYITLQQSYPDIKSGKFLTAFISSQPINDAYEIPRRAMIDEQHIYVVVNDSLKTKTISIEANSDNTVIVSGLSETDVVVVEPIINPKKGMLVNPITE